MSCIGPHNVFWKRKCFIADKQKRKIFSIICKQGPEGGMRNLFRISSLRKGGFLKNRRMAFFSVSPNVNICKFVIWIGKWHENSRKITLVVKIHWTTVRKFGNSYMLPIDCSQTVRKMWTFSKSIWYFSPSLFCWFWEAFIFQCAPQSIVYRKHNFPYCTYSQSVVVM